MREEDARRRCSSALFPPLSDDAGILWPCLESQEESACRIETG